MADKQGASRLLRRGILLNPALQRRPLPPNTLLQTVGLRISQSPTFSIQRRSYMRPNELVQSKPSRNANSEMKLSMENMSFLLPGTMVTPPFWQYPRKQFIKYAWEAVKNWVQSWAMLAMTKFQSAPRDSRFKFRFKLRRSAIIPTAKQLHVQMNEALAKGDKETLRRICSMELFNKYASMIDGRPSDHNAQWRLVQYEKKLVYPRIADDKASAMPLGPTGQSRLVRQVIVSIASCQELSRRDSQKRDARLRSKSKSLVENIVLTATIDPKTYQQGPWKIWGLLPFTTLKQHLQTMKVYNMAGELQSKR